MRLTTLTDVYDALEVWRSLDSAPARFHFDLDVRGFSKLSVALDSLKFSHGWLPAIEPGNTYEYRIRLCPRKKLNGSFESCHGRAWFLFTTPAATVRNGSENRDSVRLLLNFFSGPSRNTPLRIIFKARGWERGNDKLLAAVHTVIPQSGNVHIEQAFNLDSGRGGNASTADVYFEIESPGQSAPVYSSREHYLSIVSGPSLEDAPGFALLWDGQNVVALVADIIPRAYSSFRAGRITVPLHGLLNQSKTDSP